MAILKAIEIEIAFFFHSPRNPKGIMLDYFFMLHISTTTSSTSAFNYWDDFSN